MNSEDNRTDEEKINEEVNSKFNRLILIFAGVGFVSALALCLYLGMSVSYALGLPLIFGLVWLVARVKEG